MEPLLKSAMCLTLMTSTVITSMVACGPTTADKSAIQLAPLTVESWGETIWLKGTPLQIDGTGFLQPELGFHTLLIQGLGIDVAIPMAFEDQTLLTHSVGDEILSIMPPGSAADLTLSLVRTLTESGATTSVAITRSISIETNLTPTITAMFPDNNLYPGDLVELQGQGFLLKGEGHTVLQLDGLFDTLVPPETRPTAVVLAATAEARDRLIIPLTPDVFGILPGIFRGAVQVSNETSTQVPGNALNGVERTLNAPRIDAMSPAVAARGQRLTVTGRGFVATDPAFQAATLIRLEGEFTSRQTSEAITLKGPTALALFPDSVHDNTAMDYILRVTQTPSGELEGLGLLAGDFVGTVRPMLISGATTIVGEGTDFSLTVALQRQIVFVKYLPGFAATVAEMGLGHVDGLIRQRIMTNAARDYDGINIEFRDQRPADFVEYSIVEVGGADPNQQGLFGLDNTQGKDVGNLRFNDVIGGTNAETAEQGYYAFGGVFVRSFFQMSEVLHSVMPDVDRLPISSARFDDIFGPFMPALGGEPVAPGDLRGGQLDLAVHGLAALVGNTITHEIGHSLGLANIAGEFHNIGDNPNQIMDAGNFRPFAERAEVDGLGPAIFSSNNRTYLENILPLD